MIFISVISIVLVYLYLYIKHKDVIRFIPISHRGIINLYKIVNSNKNEVSLIKLYFNIISMFFLIIAMTYLLKVNWIFTLDIIIISILLMPLILIWRLNDLKEKFKFDNLVIYLNQFIITFKSYPKIFTTLSEIENTISGDLKVLVNNSIEEIKSGENSYTSLEKINQKYPHFIVFNLHSLAYSIESYGSVEFFEALDLIQDDLDDWIEDTAQYDYEKKRIITKVTILIGFAFVICLLALNMLFSVDPSIKNGLYQISMFIFCLIQIFTYVIANAIYNKKWIEKSEVIC